MLTSVVTEEKKCSKCKGIFPLSFFFNDKTSKSGKGSQCKGCKTQTHKIWYKANYEKVRNKVKAWNENNKEYIKQRSKNAIRKIKQDIIKEYGGKCICCDETTYEFLTIDHINNDGAKHRKELFNKSTHSGVSFYRWLRDHNYPKDNFQLLCWNCNASKGIYGKCPHNSV